MTYLCFVLWLYNNFKFVKILQTSAGHERPWVRIQELRRPVCQPGLAHTCWKKKVEEREFDMQLSSFDSTHPSM